MFTDPISDFLTRIRNGQAARHETVSSPGSKIKRAIADILVREGFLERVEETADGAKKTLTVTLKYQGKAPAIRSIRRVSHPGRRVYSKSSDLAPVLSGQGILILSTSVGLMNHKEARRRKLGGEVICEVY
ncbi:30S ribosomal protein S8 [Patescibacteria group bacterium]|jgi:small subunit ribosomal protein S8|nr:30S ribosomal protein S8 [Patescibacteria group bacterium]MDQ5919655.1 small subunit ribosomal protein [Patescibacteria group bacterium]